MNQANIKRIRFRFASIRFEANTFLKQIRRTLPTGAFVKLYFYLDVVATQKWIFLHVSRIALVRIITPPNTSFRHNLKAAR
jgi:hypothetical protein